MPAQDDVDSVKVNLLREMPPSQTDRHDTPSRRPPRGRSIAGPPMCFAEKRSRPKGGRVSAGDNNIPVHHEDLAGKHREGHALADDAGLGGPEAGAEAGVEESLAAAASVGGNSPALTQDGDGGARELDGGSRLCVRVDLLAVDRLMR
jgi:hypothetical protein